MFHYKLLSGQFLLSIILVAITTVVFGQESDSAKEIALSSVIIKAFDQNKKLKDIPGAVSYIGKAILSQFSPSSIVSALNTVPGAKMEERSPGSYRLNIRGSSLRSPFGVRNVKIYYNDIPLTDPGGNTYLNILGFYNFNSIEIIKGSNNSVYGAGTGGALLIESLPSSEQTNIFGEYSTGSYRMQNIYASLTTATNSSISKLGIQHQENNGYREHTKLKRDVYSWNGLFKMNRKSSLNTSFLYGDLNYQTPGALTKAEYNNDPRSARPQVGVIPGAISANTFIHEQMFLAGATYIQPVIKNITSKTTLYGLFAELRNPSIASYGKSSEPNFGGRTVFNFLKEIKGGAIHVNLGFEYQKGFTSVATNKNLSGNADSLRFYDEINNQQNFIFTQTTLDVKSWSLIAGASFNQAAIHFQRFTPMTLGIQNRSFNNQVAPRIAIMKKLNHINLYTSYSKGFSPPTTAELLPTGGSINIGLDPEQANSYELGIKGTFFNNLYFDINTFIFSLHNTIVLRRDARASDYYFNAGSTKQHGLEGFAMYNLFTSSKQITKSKVSISYTYYDFSYKDFKQQNNDYSHNKLPSVPANTLNAAFDISFLNGFFGSFNYYYSDPIPLNDANSEYASSYHLFSAKAGIEKVLPTLKIKLALGGENLFNQKYSLGNDINAFGGRYYNAAPGSNYYVSLSFQYSKKKLSYN